MELSFTVIGSAGKTATAKALQQLAALAGARANVRVLGEAEMLLLSRAIAAGTVKNSELNRVVLTGIYEEHSLTGIELANCFASALSEGAATAATVQVDTPAAAAVAARSGVPASRLASEYGAAADWHLAITSNTLARTSFVLQGPDNAYFRGRIAGCSAQLVNSVALALVALHDAGVSLTELERATNRGSLDLDLGVNSAQRVIGADPAAAAEPGGTASAPTARTVVFDSACSAPRLLRIIGELETVQQDPPRIVLDVNRLAGSELTGERSHLQLLGAILAKHSGGFFLAGGAAGSAAGSAADAETGADAGAGSPAAGKTAAIAETILDGAGQVNGGAAGVFTDCGEDALAQAIKQSSPETAILYAGVNNPETVDELTRAASQTALAGRTELAGKTELAGQTGQAEA